MHQRKIDVQHSLNDAVHVRVPHFGTEAFQWAFAIGKDVATFPTTFA